MNNLDPWHAIRTLVNPPVALVGRQVVADAALEQFLANRGVGWQPDAEVDRAFFAN